MSIPLILMVVGGVGFVVVVLGYFEREKLSAWWTSIRGTKGGAKAMEIEGALVDRMLHKNPAVPATVAAGSSPAAAPLPAPSGDGGTAFDKGGHYPPAPMPRAPPGTVATALAAPAAQPKEQQMDKGIVTAGALLSGWVLANWDTKTDPVPATRHADIMYLTQTTKRPGGNNVFEDVIMGSPQEIATVRNYAHTNGMDPFVDWNQDGSRKDWAADPAVNAEIKAAAENSIKAYQSAHPRNVRSYDFSRYFRRP